MNKGAKLACDVRNLITFIDLSDMSVTTFNDLVTSGAGGILLLLPNQDAIHRLSDGVKDKINALQEHLHITEFEIPIYFAEESPELLELLASLGGEAEKKPTAYESTSNFFLPN